MLQPERRPYSLDECDGSPCDKRCLGIHRGQREFCDVGWGFSPAGSLDAYRHAGPAAAYTEFQLRWHVTGLCKVAK